MSEPIPTDELAAMRAAVQEALNCGDDYVSDEVKDLSRLLAEVDRLRAELESVKDARASETDDYVRQLRALPGWCRACPPGCVSCLGPDCECYEHEEGETDAV